jgi:DNA-binding NtrC family response regulator
MRKAIGKRGGMMLTILIASQDWGSLTELVSALTALNDVNLLQAETVEETLDLASEKAIDLVVAGEQIENKSGLELAADLISVNPMITCAVVSGLTPEAFHEASEGLGIMAHLPVQPNGEHAKLLMNQLMQIKNLTG